MAVVSSTVNSGELATATQYNNLRTDAVGSTGHDHGSGQGNATISATTFDGTATVSGAWNFTGAVGIDSSVDADVTDFDLASSGDIDLVSTNNAVGAIYLRANGGTSETIKIHSDQGTSVTEAAESITILSDAGGVGIRSAANLVNAVNITVDGGTTSTMTLFNDLGTSVTEGAASVQLLSDDGGIGIKSTANLASAILLTADGGTSETIVIHADQGTGTGSIELLSDDGGIELDAGTDIILDAGGADIFLKDDGTLFGTLTNNSGELLIKSSSSGTTAATFTGANVVFAGTVDATTDFTVGSTVITDDSMVMTPSASDTVTIAGATHGILNVTTVDAAGTAADVNIDADGEIVIDAADAAGTIFKIAGTAQLSVIDGAILPTTDADIDLGSGSYQFKDAHIHGTLEADTITIGGTNVVSGSLITTLGTITAGTWNGSDVGVAYGGTGASSLTDGGVLLGSGTGAITAMAVLDDSEMIVGDGTTDPVPESGTTLRTSIGVGTGDSPTFTGLTLTAAVTLAAATENSIIEQLLMKEQWRHFNVVTGWNSAVTVDGSTSTGIEEANVNTSSTANSTARLYSSGSMSLAIGKTQGVINWSKRIVWHVVLKVQGATSLGIFRFTVGKDTGDGVGAMGNKGIGFEIANLALKGLDYGSGNVITDLSTTLTLNDVFAITIISDGSGGMEWFLNGTSKGTTTSGPTGDSADGQSTIQLEVENGSPGATQRVKVAAIKFQEQV